ncbi:uncharacterized protein LOC110188772 isoform X2 [Drosophila serrata]|uniref:uncharacterized protein LOC110188772 isoform X2 n=1 Tax=Drosophila serrata TaxID=7274 RepID=UPI000A1D315D|nr:uncharacterized protein LOC110188772 isoform X2 [Drosophila serrata]
MGERLYSWPSDRIGKVATALYMHRAPAVHPQLYQQPPPTSLSSGSMVVDYNKLTGIEQRFNSGTSGLPPNTPAIGTIHDISSSSSCCRRTRYMPYNVNRNGVDPSLSSHLSEHQQSQQQKMSSYIYHYATIHQQHGNLNLKQTMPSAISPIAHSTQFFSSASTINSVKSLENPPLVTSVVMPCSSVVTTVVGNGVLGGTVCNDNEGRNFHNGSDVDDAVTLQITNLDYSLDDSSLRSFLMNQLNPITPVVSLVLEGSSYAKVTVPDLYFAKQVVSNLHRKKIGHKRMLVSYTRDSSTTEVNTLRCQVAGLLKIYNDPDTEIQSVRLTNFMKFLMNIVRLLEQRPNMYVYEIRSALECGLTTTFEFGFPNLYSIIAAYDDIFTINNGPTQERSDVTLNNNCELRQSNHPNLFGSEKMTYAKPRTQQRNFSTYSQAPPPLKIRALGSDFAPGFVSNLSFKAEVNNLQTYQESGGLMLAPNKSSPPSTNSSLLSSLESCRSNYSLYSNWFNKEKSMHDSSLKLFNSSFNSSGDLNASLGAGDLTNITSSTAIMADAALDERSSSKLWHRRQASLYKQPIQNQLQAHPLGHHSEIDTGELYESIKSLNESQNLNTAPPEKIPFWIDPIWSNRFEPYPNNNILNIRLPELKSSHKVIPTMLLSPYTISKNENLKRKLFNFDNHDRNIA